MPSRCLVFPVLPLVLASTLLGCGDDGPSGLEPKVVMVVDDGIDPSIEAFEGKVLATKTLVCAAGTPGPVDERDQKTQWLEYLKQRDDSCWLVEGIKPKSDPLVDVQDQRVRWNEVIVAQRSPAVRFTRDEYDALNERFEEAFSTAAFHGTATAGVVARDNVNVRLVLVERQLGSGENLLEEFQCIRQSDVDEQVKLFEDPEIRAAMIAMPLSRVDEELRALQVKHGVHIINESFGPLPRETVEQLQRDKGGCEPLDLERLAALESELRAQWLKAHSFDGPLVVRSAGNSGQRVDDGDDFAQCGEPGENVMVGSYDASMRLSRFSNFGACIDVFAPGESVVAPLSGGWLYPLYGTSFSAPLVVRHLTLQAELDPTDAAAMRAALINLRDSERRLPDYLFPRNLRYQPTSGPPGSALSLPGVTPPSARRPSRISRHALRGSFLAPLLWRHRRR